jgi:hypothetical protein
MRGEVGDGFFLDSLMVRRWLYHLLNGRLCFHEEPSLCHESPVRLTIFVRSNPSAFDSHGPTSYRRLQALLSWTFSNPVSVLVIAPRTPPLPATLPNIRVRRTRFSDERSPNTRKDSVSKA